MNVLTTVISVRGKDPLVLRAHPLFVYVGRPVRGWSGSPYSNPFKVSCPGRSDITAEDVVARFERWLRTGEHSSEEYPKAMARRREAILGGLTSLRGKHLGCWCGDWKHGQPEIACHAVVLAKLADEPMAAV